MHPVVAYRTSARSPFLPRIVRCAPLLRQQMENGWGWRTQVKRRGAAGHRLFGTIGSSLATASFVVIAIGYFIQLHTVQPSLVRGEADGLAILSQYNPHGVFIALEELGFLVAGLSFLFLALALGSSRLERATRWVLFVASALVVVSFVGMSAAFGLNLEYRFEVTCGFRANRTLIPRDGERVGAKRRGCAFKMTKCSASGQIPGCFRGFFSHRPSFELDPDGPVHKPVEQRVGDRRVGDQVVPL
jgi:hypothetical protein